MRKFSLLLLLVMAFVLPMMAVQPATVPVAAQGETLALPGLHAPVTVVYDHMGIPHIYAENAHDLFMAQGYVESMDRFWQMDWWRHLSSGTLSEISGAETLGTDMFLRTLMLKRATENDLAVTSEEGMAALEAYTAGVNAYLDGKAPSDVAMEYELAASMGMEPEIKPWIVQDTLRWYKMMALDLSGNFQQELVRAGLIDAVGSLGTRFLLPEYPFGQHPVIVEPGGVDYTGMSETSWQVPANMDYSGVSRHLVGGVDIANLDSLYPSVFGRGEGIGSNSWAIGPGMTDSGLPYLANDPHLGIQNPSIWYEVGLHCVELSAECPYDVVGVGFAGSPGIIIGHNNFYAWGFTNVGTDVQDVYMLTINPDNENQYMLDGEWVDFEIITETIMVQGGDPVELNIRVSVWGPVISEVIGFEQVFALRWVALDGNTTIDALLEMNRGQSWDDFRWAAQLFDTPAQNLLYADIEGNIGYQMPGKTPIRAEGHDPRVPVDGSTSDNAWQGFVPFDELPMIFNPDAGYIVTANNTVVPADYPYYIDDIWAHGYRAMRIEWLIQNDEDGVLTVEDIQAIHGDNYNAKADFLIPALQGLEFEDAAMSEFVNWLAAWDRQNDADSGEAALFEMFWVKLLENSLYDDLGDILGSGALTWYLMDQMLQNPTHVIYGVVWDDSRTPDVTETAVEVLAMSFEQAVEAVSTAQGDDPAAWSWGAVHQAVFTATPFGEFGDPELDALFNVSIGTGGGTAIVNATGWSASNPFEVTALPSMRQILIPGDWDASLRTNTLGQSGNPMSPHYSDQVEMWANVEYHADWYSREAVEADAEMTLTLTPE